MSIFHAFLLPNVTWPEGVCGMTANGARICGLAHRGAARGDNSGARLRRGGPRYGGILSTANDMYRWHRALLGDSVLSRSSRMDVRTPFANEGYGDSFYSYGCAIFETSVGGLLCRPTTGKRCFLCRYPALYRRRRLHLHHLQHRTTRRNGDQRGRGRRDFPVTRRHFGSLPKSSPKAACNVG